VFGYTLCPDCRFELFFLLYGPPCTGKSTAVDTLRAMLGETNASGLILERLGGRFDLLIGKRANIVYDASEIDRTAEGTLKSLSSGEHQPVEEKYHQTVTMPLPAKHIFATNTLPRFHDTSGGIFRRIGMAPFDRPCPAEERDVGLKAALRAELPGILAWSIDGPRRLFTRGRFEAPAHVESLILGYRRDSNPVAIFIRDECEAAPRRSSRPAGPLWSGQGLGLPQRPPAAVLDAGCGSEPPKVLSSSFGT
jgi:putative DNA primase/helicase